MGGYSGADLVEIMDTKIATPFDHVGDSLFKDGLNGTDLESYIRSFNNDGVSMNTGESKRQWQSGADQKNVINPLDQRGGFLNNEQEEPEQEFNFTSNNVLDNAPTKVVSDQDAFEWSNPSDKFIVFEKPNVTGSAVGHNPNELLDRLNVKGEYQMPMVENEFFETLRVDPSERRSHGLQAGTDANPLPINENFDHRLTNCSKNNIPAYLVRTLPKLSVASKDGNEINT